MRYLLQALVVVVIALVMIAMFAPEWLVKSKAPPLAANPPAMADDSRAAPLDDPAITTSEPPSPDDSDIAPRDQSKLIRALRGAAQAVDEKLGPQADTSITSQIEDQLDQADRILSDAQAANRQALAHANRQQRLPGRAPHLLIVVVPGLGRANLEAIEPSEHPVLARWLTEGARVTGCQRDPNATTPAAAVQTLVYGKALGAAPSSLPPSLLSMLWHSSYNTTVVGDLSWLTATEPEQLARHGVERTFGFRQASELSAAFPKQVWSNGVRAGIPANAESETISAIQIFANEAAIQIAAEPKSPRPNAVVVVLPPSEATPVAQGEAFIAECARQLDQSSLTARTLVLVVGLPTSADDQPVALVRWPRHIAAGQTIDRSCGLRDLAPTLLALTDSQRVSPSWAGASQAEIWRATAKTAATPPNGPKATLPREPAATPPGT